MIKYYCDKCKNEFHERDLKTIRIENLTGRDSFYLKTRMLCDNCNIEILNIIDGENNEK